MKIILIALALVLTGCTQILRPHHYDHALKVCSANGGIDQVLVSGLSTEFKAICKNGAIFEWDRLTVK